MDKSHSKKRLEDSLSLPGNQRTNELEEAFFVKEDQRIIEKLRAMKKMKETKEALKIVSGINDDTILQKLIDLSIRPETLASLMLVPLIEVAWADGELDTEEKKAILLAATDHGIAKGSIDHDLLRRWFAHRPSPDLLNAWTLYVKELCTKLPLPMRRKLKEQMLGHALGIAEASGGILGLINKISPAEKAVLDKLDTAFGN